MQTRGQKISKPKLKSSVIRNNSAILQLKARCPDQCVPRSCIKDGGCVLVNNPFTDFISIKI